METSLRVSSNGLDLFELPDVRLEHFCIYRWVTSVQISIESTEDILLNTWAWFQTHAYPRYWMYPSKLFPGAIPGSLKTSFITAFASRKMHNTSQNMINQVPV